MDPENDIEETYRRKNDRVFAWKANRVMARTSLGVFANSKVSNTKGARRQWAGCRAGFATHRFATQHCHAPGSCHQSGRPILLAQFDQWYLMFVTPFPAAWQDLEEMIMKLDPELKKKVEEYKAAQEERLKQLKEEEEKEKEREKEEKEKEREREKEKPKEKEKEDAEVVVKQEAGQEAASKQGAS